MISIFPLWIFHLYVETFQQHWHMEYISLRWYDIPELVAPIRMSLIEAAANKEATETVEVITSKMLRLTWLTVMKYLCHNDHRYVPFVGSTSWSFPYSRLIIGFVTRLTRRVPLVELDPQVLLEHLNSPQSLVGFVLLEP